MASANSAFNNLGFLLKEGSFLDNLNSKYCCPDCNTTILNEPIKFYFLGGVSIFLEFAEIVNLGTPETKINIDCCINTRLGGNALSKWQENFEYPPNNIGKTCPNNFESCLNSILDLFTPTQQNNIINNFGLVEIGSINDDSQLCIIKEYIDQVSSGLTQLEIFNFISVILKTGIILSCYNNEVQIGITDTWLNWLNTITPLPGI